jgi:predicted nucleic acid-binding protein
LRQVFTPIFAPSDVSAELGIALEWLQVQAPSDTALVKALATQLHAGEAEAIALAMELGDTTFLRSVHA